MLTNFELQNLVNTLAIMDRDELFKLATILKTKYPATSATLENAIYVAEIDSQYSKLEELV